MKANLVITAAAITPIYLARAFKAAVGQSLEAARCRACALRTAAAT